MKNKLILAFLLMLVAACKSKEELSDAEMAKKLYDEGMRYAYKGAYSGAIANFNKIDEDYPYTVYEHNAIVMLVYLYYKEQNYSQLIPLVDVYVKANPVGADVPYLLYLKGLSYYTQIKDYRKDKETLMQVREVTETMEREFPFSRYTADLTRKKDFIMRNLLLGELDVAEFYIKKENCPAAVARYLQILEPTSVFAPYISEYRGNIEPNLHFCLKNLGIGREGLLI